MKKALSLLMALTMLFTLCACGGESTEEVTAKTAEKAPTETTTETPKETPVEPQEEAPKATPVALGETASTDLIDFTLKNAEFTYYAENTLDDTYLTATTDSDTHYAASLGNCLVSFTFTVTNKDRGGSISFCGSHADDWSPEWKITYNGETYPLKSFDLNNNAGKDRYISLETSAVLDNATGKYIESYNSSNALLHAGETITFRTIGVINTDPKDLNAGFDLTLEIPAVGGESQLFTYTVPAK